jgi:hypothetical protein
VARQRDTVDHSTVEIECFDPGVALYAVTFG